MLSVIGNRWPPRTWGAAQLLARMLAFALILRVIAVPFIMAAPAPGLIAICSGGKIVYISMETGLPVDESVSAAGIDCPVVAAAHVIPVIDLPLFAPKRRVIATVGGIEALAPLAAPGRAGHQPRAPPVPV